MINDFDWTTHVPALLKFYSTQYKGKFFQTRKKIHILFVEGSTDRDYYRELFSYDFITDQSERINLSFDDDNRIKIAGFPSAYFKFKGIEIDNKDICKFEFVIKCLEFFNQLEDELCIDCYGFIDRDFYHNISNIKQLDKTTEHDRETNLIRCYMPDYISSIRIDRDYCIELFSNALLFSLRQGILEKTSFDYMRLKDDIKEAESIEKVKIATHRVFQDGCKNRDYSDFDFLEYVLKNDDIFDDSFVELYKKNLGEIRYESEIKDYVEKWLSKKKLEDFEEKRLTKILELCNGHMLINQLIHNGEDYFKDNVSDYFDEEIFVKNIKSFVRLDTTKIFDLMPLKAYKKFRKEKGYIYK